MFDMLSIAALGPGWRGQGRDKSREKCPAGVGTA